MLWFISEQKDGRMWYEYLRLSDLSSVERFVSGIAEVEEEHVNKGDEEAGGIPGGACIVWKPFIEDQNDEVAEQTGHENNLWDES